MTNWIRKEGTSNNGLIWSFVTGGGKEVSEFLEEVFSGSDRTLSIVTCAYIENLLHDILNEFFVDDKGIKQNVFDPMKQGALSSLSAMIDIAFLLGFLSRQIHEQLKIIARIRNQFAHNHDLRTFYDLLGDKKARKDLQRLTDFADQHIISVDGDPSSILGDNIRIRYQVCFSFVQLELAAAIYRAGEQHRTEYANKSTIAG